MARLRENSCVLMDLQRVSGKGKAVKTVIGYMPTPDAIDTEGLDIRKKQ